MNMPEQSRVGLLPLPLHRFIKFGEAIVSLDPLTGSFSFGKHFTLLIYIYIYIYIYI